MMQSSSQPSLSLPRQCPHGSCWSVQAGRGRGPEGEPGAAMPSSAWMRPWAPHLPTRAGSGSGSFQLPGEWPREQGRPKVGVAPAAAPTPPRRAHLYALVLERQTPWSCVCRVQQAAHSASGESWWERSLTVPGSPRHSPLPGPLGPQRGTHVSMVRLQTQVQACSVPTTARSEKAWGPGAGVPPGAWGKSAVPGGRTGFLPKPRALPLDCSTLGSGLGLKSASDPLGE